jgi:hypothetical protein
MYYYRLQINWVSLTKKKWEAASHSTTQGFPNICSNLEAHTVLTRALPDRSLSWARSIQSILILFSYMCRGLPSGLFPSCFHTNVLYAFSSSSSFSFVLHAPPICNICNIYHSKLLLLWNLKYIHSSRSNVVIKALCYKTEGSGFQIRWGELNFSIYLILPAALALGFTQPQTETSIRNRNNNVSGE